MTTGRWRRGAATRRVTAGLAGLTLLAGAVACGRADAEPRTPLDPPPGPVTLPAPTLEPDPPALAAVRSEPVRGLTGPGGEPFEVAVRDPGRAGHDRRIGLRTFSIALRDDPPTELVCASCHRPGQVAIRPERTESAHRNVLPRHPERAGTACGTCHAPDDVEQLVLLDGERVPLGHAYLLCAQCHYSQVEAWAAGVHGKRLDGWRGRRILMGCADCHDPHQPGLQPRTPFPGPILPRTAGSRP
jgi:hypothetical protein